ncbi:carbon-monoxide dehydrogenase large subunit [Streptomyces sulfonofaciens]|uniref:Carbon-monoxide dehydrogenase large subunit n=1 Tax=Streptomyces sulfonofaciens TaxID=68272 RepID=A0A919GG48_9ACTN|nr:xanthine dehydrogenase family protein molybdopterin-binding subunit [Streptomyces sulfonofaciens]GHH83721.1 carbon-monoxide dehydrogenase large subunit [Streptomyces sulfonofaciens]
MSTAVGRPVNRVDGRCKVTGAARYTAEIVLPGLVHAAVVGADIPSGRVTAIGEERTRAADGVLSVLTHENLSRIATQPPLLPSLLGTAAPGETFFPMQDDVVHYAGQPVAIVIADSHERAQYAASLLDVTYERTDSTTTIDEGRAAAYEAETLFGRLLPARNERGDVVTALARAPVRVDVAHHYAANHHNALEPSATTAVWYGEHLTLYDSTMGIRASQLTVASLLGVPISHVRVITEFVGGGFGGKALTWPHVTLAAMAARHVRRPVRLSLTRPQTYTSNGHREEQEQWVSLGATKDGLLTAVRHEKLSVTSPFDDWAEPATGVTTQLYACENYLGFHRLIRGNTMTPTFTRCPGESLGVSTLEVAMDKLAYATGVDPVELRLRNHASVDDRGNAWSSDGLEECLRTGARRFGWAQRDPEPRSRREGDWLIGSGMSVAAYPVAFFMPVQQARVRIYSDGSAVMQSGTQEFGTGSTTVMTQVAADGLGMDIRDVTFESGDTDLPNASASVGSMGASMVSAAVHNAAVELRRQLVAMAVADTGSPLHGADPSAVVVHGSRMSLDDTAGAGESYAELMRRNHLTMTEALGSWTPPPMDTPHGLLTFGAHFVEVAVDPELGLVRVRRMVGVFAPGRVLNPKLARSQLMGGMLWGMSQALLEGNQMDPRLGRWGARNLGEYLVPVNADVPDVTVEFVDVTDTVVNPLGVKGVGEVGQVATAAAVMNAVFHATGRRIEKLPMTPELVMDPPDTPA